MKLTPENYQLAYDTILRPYFQRWRWKEWKLPVYDRKRWLFNPNPFASRPDRVGLYVFVEDEHGQRDTLLLVLRPSDEGWKALFSWFIYRCFVDRDDIPLATKREVLKRLLKAGFYTIYHEGGIVMDTTLALQGLQVR